MARDLIGDWGSSLGDEDYACALAALGVLQSGAAEAATSTEAGDIARALGGAFRDGERMPVWRGAVTASAWREAPRWTPAALAAGWRLYLQTADRPRRAPRLAIPEGLRARRDLLDFDAACAWLLHPGASLASLVLAPGGSAHRAPRTAWHFPLHVAAPGDERHAPLRTAWRALEESRRWVRSLTRWQAMSTGRDASDLLLLAPGAARALDAEPPARVRASFVVCFDEWSARHSELDDRYRALCDRLGAAGIAVVGALPEGILTDWLAAFLGELAHDRTVDAAVVAAGRDVSKRLPLVYGRPGALDQCRVVEVAARLDRETVAHQKAEEACLDRAFAALDAGGAPPPGTRESRRTPEPHAKPPAPAPRRSVVSAPAKALRVDLADRLRARAFTAESIDGDAAVKEIALQKKALDTVREPRWILANAWRGDAPGAAARSLAPSATNLLAVHIGPAPVAREDAAFPDGGLDFSGGDVPLDVQLELSGGAVAAVTALSTTALGELRPELLLAPGGLPAAILEEVKGLVRAPDAGEDVVCLSSARVRLPVAGNSTVALFAVAPQAGRDEVEGRVAVIHHNRVLQTKRLRATVGALPDQGAGLAIAAETTVHPRDDDLEERREYDVAIQVSDLGGRLHLNVERDGKPEQVLLDPLAEKIKTIDTALMQAAVTWDHSKPLSQQDALRDLLYTLASAGSSLEQHLRKRLGSVIDSWRRIHLLPFTQRFLPLEYVYSGMPPQVDAEVCPNAASSLKGERCSAPGDGECPHARSKAHLCPLQFWGFSRLIERHGVIGDGDAPAAAPSRPIAVPSTRPFGAVRSAVMAAAARTFEYKTQPAERAAERSALIDAVRAEFPPLVEASDWDGWRAAVKSRPELLLLLVHSDKFKQIPVLEIGKGSLLGEHEILEDVSGLPRSEPQLLVLLGCSTAGVEVDFEPYPVRFRDAGADIVLASVAPMRGIDAVPIAKRLAALINERLRGAEPQAFGDVLPQLRRELLSEGHPGVLGLVGFGDGDWLLGGA